MTSTPNFNRRTALLSGLAIATLTAAPVRSASSSIHVVKGTGCECCTAWVAHLREEGFGVTEEERYGTLLMTYKTEVGVPQGMVSCHTGIVEGYVVEGHVPAAEIRGLLSERPDAIGLAVPGMPYGSPGMGSENEREAFEVFLIRNDGSDEIYARYTAKG